MTVDPAAYAQHIADLVRVIPGDPEISRAAGLFTRALNAGGVIQAFGSGHSEAVAMEIAGRAGGLVPTSKLALRDIVLYGDAPRAELDRYDLERDPAIARTILDLAPVHPADLFVVISNSGVNGVVVELATLVKERGHDLIAITSRAHSEAVASRHPSGRKLADLADVVLDNRAPYGDAVLPLPDGGATGAVSTITSALLAQLVVAETVRNLLEAGEVPPVYLSANVPEGDAHNLKLEALYEGRIRRGA
ncbi:sugar isomerase domain-containing protein [Nonomuraea phyllanthi]|uniref:Sugar isomerase domain-containing protein n=1 Tax=Nonomuraea phyllanthi TaxID=2219224 RepID=A0A5C4V8G7_9ACTN|nr:SIS domain-containing protein [Nonomuraea phyllanthi]KAB8187542.1 sugar isomerase domain-containing protein [Nonomuraea phyllanthi]QFY07026.1 sugar isomerase domain-containing protein [Nonomuraea phyllanthi]